MAGEGRQYVEHGLHDRGSMVEVRRCAENSMAQNLGVKFQRISHVASSGGGVVGEGGHTRRMGKEVGTNRLVVVEERVCGWEWR